ncbi:MAG: helix-turn-helix transcriptional regulator, partial [Candidatus Acidiferrum sp.]
YTVESASTSEGFLLLDSALRPIFFNRLAAEILAYPQKPETLKDLKAFLTGKIHSTLFRVQGSRVPSLVSEFQSGRRRYQCRAYRLGNPVNGNGDASMALILERFSMGSLTLGQVGDRFHLTIREQEVLKHLLVGRTTKEIATGMEISPHTVKAFLRMIMVKMGVSTRSGIVGKAFTTRP